jgi:hypothetical protein
MESYSLSQVVAASSLTATYFFKKIEETLIHFVFEQAPPATLGLIFLRYEFSLQAALIFQHMTRHQCCY